MTRVRPRIWNAIRLNVEDKCTYIHTLVDKIITLLKILTIVVIINKGWKSVVNCHFVKSMYFSDRIFSKNDVPLASGILIHTDKQARPPGP
jgi:hypothetical protein